MSGHGDGAGIDHGVERPVGDLVEHDRIEGFSRGLDADMAQHIVAPIVLKRAAIHEGLRHRLDSEKVLVVAGGVHLAVDRGERDAEGGGIGLAELGDIVGDPAAAHARNALVQLDKKVFNGSGRSGACFSRHTRRASRLVQEGPPMSV